VYAVEIDASAQTLISSAHKTGISSVVTDDMIGALSSFPALFTTRRLGLEAAGFFQ
jgi:hypothetical protein